MNCRQSVAAVLLFGASINAAGAQVITLSCNGSFKASKGEATASGAAVIDIDHKTVSSPVADFDMLWVRENVISFSGTQGKLVVTGHIDRITGKMTVFWRMPGQVFEQMEAHAVLHCTPSKRLF